jgi:hypothetical protein
MAFIPTNQNLLKQKLQHGPFPLSISSVEKNNQEFIQSLRHAHKVSPYFADLVSILQDQI